MSDVSSSIEQYVQEKIARGDFRSREEFAAEAIRLYREVESKHDELSRELREWMKRTGQGLSSPLDREALKAELRAQALKSD
jgi:Arc/MetJ-type ribon-helix-helix transcriptional regulator